MRRVIASAAGSPAVAGSPRATLLPRLARKAGIDGRDHAHGFRHTYASELARRKPEKFYVNVHNPAFPAGAIRGAAEVTLGHCATARGRDPGARQRSPRRPAARGWFLGTDALGVLHITGAGTPPAAPPPVFEAGEGPPSSPRASQLW